MRAISLRFRLVRLALAIAGALAAPSSAAPASFPAVQGSGGAVVSDEAAATAAGLEVLEQGGNAVDAAVATALALAVVHPEAGNLGGGGFAVVRVDDELATLDFRETAPARASPGMYLDSAGDPRPQASLLGPLAAGVPGSPVGLWELHQRFGQLDWPRVVAPAHRLAVEGFSVTRRLARSLAETRDLLARFPETAAVWLPGGEAPAPGHRMRVPALARTLEEYARHGPEALTSGANAAAIERASTRYGGVLRVADLAAYRALWRDPLRFEAYGWSFVAMDLPSSGGIIVGQLLKQLEALGWHELPRFGAARAHLFAETSRRSFADRFLLGDPATSHADSRALLAGSWLLARRASLRLDRATPSSEVVNLPEIEQRESLDTTHLSVVDRQGNVVALTTTLNGAFGCKLLVPELGIFLNNEMDDFATSPGRPNLFGLVQGDANAVAPGKRMLSSMSPTIASRGTEWVSLGGRGGSKIPTATAQVLLHLLVDHDPLQTAVDRPRVHHQWLPDLLRAESDALSPETAEALRALGHHIEELAEPAKVNAVRLLADGRLEAAADPRGPGTAAVLRPTP